MIDVSDIPDLRPATDDQKYDFPALNKELDRVKSRVFLGKSAAFLGPLLSSLDFVWTEDFPTSATNGQTLWWHPQDFMDLSPDERIASLLHEIWHVARIHLLRIGSRDPKMWNYACDIRINRDLVKDGYTIGSDWVQAHPEIPHELEEEIYDFLIQNKMPPPPPNRNDGDMIPNTKASAHAQINNVMKAVHQAKIGGQPGAIPGGIEQILNQFLAPIIPWETVLYQFFNDMLNEDYSWRKPSRRHDPRELYLPSRFTDDGRLEHLIYYLDVSGSITDADLLRFNSEVKYIKDTFNPVKLSLVQFDTRITREQIITENDQFDEVKIVGRGGTSLVPVREHILENRPTAAIIFSDLYCDQMRRLPEEIPVIWIVVNNEGATVPFGKKLHIKT